MTARQSDPHPPIRSTADLRYSIYVAIAPGTPQLLHWRGYKRYETARTKAECAGGRVSNVAFLRRRFGPVKDRRHHLSAN